MVEGLDRFKAELGSYSENYIVIGGTACNVVLEISFGLVIAQSPNHDPHQNADDIDEPRPPRRMNPDEDNQSDKIIKKDETSHNALILITVAKIQCRYRCAMECSEL